MAITLRHYVSVLVCSIVDIPTRSSEMNTSPQRSRDSDSTREDGTTGVLGASKICSGL